MTIEQAIENRERCLAYLIGCGPKATTENVEAVRLSIEALREKAERRWIPVTERLPEKEGAYLCFVGAPYYMPIRVMKYQPKDLVAGASSNEKLWRDSTYEGSPYVYDWFVEYWMPLPEPPKEEEV